MTDDTTSPASTNLLAPDALGQSLELRDSRSSLTAEDDREDMPIPQSSLVGGVARHTLGLILLLVVVFLWTLSNFLGSSIFADNTYAKPFFLTYLNTTCFVIPLIPVLIRSTYQAYRAGELKETVSSIFSRQRWTSSSDEAQLFLKSSDNDNAQHKENRPARIHLGWGPTARLSFTFCILWFLANYFAMACLQFTTVASTTILTSTSSIWTLLIGALTRTERFTYRKLFGVIASLLGIVLISLVDTSSSNTPSSATPRLLSIRDDIPDGPLDPFPEKTPAQLALGDSLAALSALIYGLYTIMLKRTTLKALPLQLNMPLFFGLVGLFNAFLLLPLFPILSWTGLEKFQLPPSRQVWTILLINSASSLVSDICWAYAMLLTSPLVVTVGLSLTIPLSLVGEILIQGRKEGLIYWVGAFIVVFSFVFVDRQEVKDDDKAANTLSAQDLRAEVITPYESVQQSERNSEDLPR